jgi:sarcosine oxidase gamma subunit
VTSGERPPELPVRREVVEALRRLEPFRIQSDTADHYAAVLSPEELVLLSGATDDEKRVAAVESLRALATIVDMGDGTSGIMPADPDWP